MTDFFISMTVPCYQFVCLFFDLFLLLLVSLCNSLKIPEVKFLDIFNFLTESHSVCLCNSNVTWRNSCRKSMSALNKYYLLVMKMTVMAKRLQFTSAAECKKI